MHRYIGLDVHAQSCTAAVMGPSGRHLREQRLETNGEVLRGFVCSVAGQRHLCVEEGLHSDWLYELLEPVVDEIVVAIPEKQRGAKNDSADAWARADELRRGAVAREVFKAPRRFTALRQAVRVHRMVQVDLVRAKNRWRAVLRSRAIPVSGEAVYKPTNRQRLIKQLPASHRAAATVLGEELDTLQDVYEQAEQLLQDEAAKTPEVRRLATAPGIGPVRAAQIVAIVISPHRFRTKRQLWCYAGLGVVTRVSAEWEKGARQEWARRKAPQTRGLNHNRHPILKSVFKGAALTVILKLPDLPLHRAYQRQVQEGTDPALARLTVARRIAAAELAMWKNQEDYDPTRHATDT
jgi:transposase